MKPFFLRIFLCFRSFYLEIFISVFLFLLLQFSPLKGQDTLRLITYNILKYGVVEPGCTNPTATKNTLLNTVMPVLNPDIIGMNEIGNSQLHSLNLLTNVLKPYNTNFERATFTNNAFSSITNALFYRSDKLVLYNEQVINHPLRDINVYTLYYKDPNLAIHNDTSFVKIVLIHYKAGSTTGDKGTREQQADYVMAFLDGLAGPGNYIIMGDFNMQSSSELAYQKMVAHPNLDTRMYDPVNSPGSWNNNAAFKIYHSQSTRTSNLSDCGSSGGLDDRFDQILCSDYIINESANVKYVAGSYDVIGQDGIRLNGTVTSPANTEVSGTVGGALEGISDHLPVLVKLKMGPVFTALEGQVALGVPGLKFSVTPNPFDSELNLESINQTGHVLNVKISLLNLLGQVVFGEEKRLEQGNSQDRLSTIELPSGLYWLRMEDQDGGIVIKKLIKR